MKELKIKIKEVVEDYWDLPCGLRSMIYVEGICPCPLQEDAIYELDKLGYIRGTKRLNTQRNQWEAKFRKETIRDATPEEEEAWYEIHGLAAFHKISKEEISKYHRYYFVDNHERYNELLKDKEIILELVEVNE